MRALLAALIVCAFAHPATAAYRHHHWRHHHHAREHLGWRAANASARTDRRPAAWCGWYMRRLLGVADPRYNLARNWAHWGSPSAPGIGVVVVWPHHVGRIVGRAGNGLWIVLSGNDGHQVRERARSVAGAIAFRS
jgi:hypothetical protein